MKEKMSRDHAADLLTKGMTPEQRAAFDKKVGEVKAREKLVANEIGVAAVAVLFGMAYRSAHGDTVVEDSMIWKDARSFIEAGKAELRIDLFEEAIS